MKIPVLITARLTSTRLPRKHLLELGEMTVIEHIYNRCLHFGFMPIVCIPDEKWPSRLQIETFTGDIDPLIRIKQCAEDQKINKFHHLDGDDPYFDPKEVERSFGLLTDETSIVHSTISSSEYALGMMGTSYGAGNREITLPERRKERNIRLTLDYEEDYWFLLTLWRMGADYTASRDKVENIALFPLGCMNWFRNEEWKERQLAESGH